MHWLDETTLGQRVLLESRALSIVLTDYAGLLALQVGAPEFDLIPSRRYSRVIKSSVRAGGDLVARPQQLPVATSTMDLVLMVHTLEEADDVKTVLAEAARILKGEGVLVITGFRLGSLRGLREWSASIMRRGHFVSLWQLRWLIQGAGLEWQGVKRLSTGTGTGLTSKTGSLAWSDLVSGSYAAIARKHVEKPIVFRPRWNTSKLAKRGTVPEARHAS